MNDSKCADDLFPPKREFITRRELDESLALAKQRHEKGDIRCYFVAAAGNTMALADIVNMKLREGFSLWGSVSSDNQFLYQPMVK